LGGKEKKTKVGSKENLDGGEGPTTSEKETTIFRVARKKLSPRGKKLKKQHGSKRRGKTGGGRVARGMGCLV